MYAGLKDVRARVKRAEERTKGNRKRKGEDTVGDLSKSVKEYG